MSKCCAYLVASAAVAAALTLWPAGARAESPEAGDATYHNLRYNDDFSYLADPAKSTDWWDKIKYIPLGNGPYGPTYVSLGGELRERLESYGHPNFGLHAPNTDMYLLQRAQLDVDLHATDYLRAFLQLGEMERYGSRGVSSTTDIDHLDVMQGFVDLKPPSPLGDAPVVRVGREELLFGFQRLIAVREGPNLRRDFDGLRLGDKIGDATVDLFSVHPVNSGPDAFNDHTNYRQTLAGGYGTAPVFGPLKADLYWLNYENDNAKYRGLSGVEHRTTVGGRLFGTADGFDWNAEAAAQSGTFRNRDIHAYLLAGVAGYTFQSLPWTPRIGVEANDASGDNSHSGTIGTFNAMYPRLPYFAETSLLVPANVIDVRPMLTVKPAPDLMAVFGWDNLWRASTTDGLYGSGMTEYANTNKATSKRIGTELSVDLRYRYDQHLTMGAIAADMLVGPAVEQALGRNVTFFVLFATYRI